MNKTLGPGQQPLFGYSAEPPLSKESDANAASADLLSNPSKDPQKPLKEITSLEGITDDPSFTKVVDRRWYDRNKHIYPASVWQEFDPEKDYQNEIQRDAGGNTFFFSR